MAVIPEYFEKYFPVALLLAPFMQRYGISCKTIHKESRNIPESPYQVESRSSVARFLL